MIIDIILIVSSLLFFADLFFVNYLWMNFNDKLFNIFNALLIILLLIIIIFAFIKLLVLISKRNIKAFSFWLIIVLIVGAGVVLSSSAKNQQVFTLTNINAKETNEDGACFLVLNNSELKKFIRVECDKETFDQIETSSDELYTVDYRIGFFNDDYGALGSIDNR